jgi:hypothetical protein
MDVYALGNTKASDPVPGDNTIRAKVIHVNRNLNVVAHNCAQQAIIFTKTLPICSGRNSSHRNLACPIDVAVHHLQLPGTVVLSVQRL